MSDIISISPGNKARNKAVCHVAYTLNNTQPVACTIIGDQPLFYMDYEVDYEDEDMALFDEADLRVLEKELVSLKKEMDCLDKISEDFIQAPEIHFENFLENEESIVKPDANNAPGNVKTLINVLSQSRVAATYIDFAKEHGTKIIMSGQTQSAEYDRNSQTITISDNLDFSEQILLCARELRRHWQHRQGALINPLLFHPDNAILINRAQVADLAVNMVRIAWELQLGGIKQAWERIENSSLSDLGHAFARESFMDFRSLNNGEASAAVFESWFLSERCRTEDKKLIQKMLADYQGYVFDLEEAEQAITPALIAALGEMPYGKNYLAQHAATIMDDPIFTEIRDRSNANFLWFIKFERSFRETEQELQHSPEPTADGIRSSQAQHNIRDTHYAQQENNADIISLFPDSIDELGDGQTADSAQAGDKSNKKSNRLAPKAVGKRKNNKGSADIIYLQRWSGE
jgi:hypothetical protein